MPITRTIRGVHFTIYPDTYSLDDSYPNGTIRLSLAGGSIYCGGLSCGDNCHMHDFAPSCNGAAIREFIKKHSQLYSRTTPCHK
jgi:hypothetical protein